MDNAKVEFIHYFEAGDGVTLLLLHGTGGTEHDLVGIRKGYRARCEHSESAWPRARKRNAALFRTPPGGVFDIEDLHNRTDELADWISAITVEKEIDDRPIVALGFSNGANIAGSLLLSRPGPARRRDAASTDGAVHCPTSCRRWGWNASPGGSWHERSADRDGGNESTRDTPAGMRASVDLYWQPGEHGLGQGDLDQIRAWFSTTVW
ncbi:MAG: hypothetical protein R2843_01285 [Thermomicrobiales bacterium]